MTKQKMNHTLDGTPIKPIKRDIDDIVDPCDLARPSRHNPNPILWNCANLGDCEHQIRTKEAVYCTRELSNPGPYKERYGRLKC